MTAQVLRADVTFQSQRLRQPLVLSTGAISEVTEARVMVWVRAEGKEAAGQGSIYLSDLWSWPDSSLSHEHRDAALRAQCSRIAQHLVDWCAEPAHPLELGMRLHHAVCDSAPAEGPPTLALAMCLSPFDAALHDAVGLAQSRSAFGLYDDPTALPSVDMLFPDGGARRAIARLLRRPPLQMLPAWLIVGKTDDLDRDVRPWAVERGYRCFKLKIMGRDNAADVSRTVEVFRALCRWHVKNPWLSVDSNEANPDADSVLDYLLRLREADGHAFEALRYLEQPTGRDIQRNRFDWRAVTRLKPVLLDEGLTGPELLSQSREQGWSGLALKTCKGHSFALVAAAWAHEHRMLLSLQDLTNPGYAAIHAALLAAHLPTINGVELNSPQFTPAANQPWLPRLAGLFEPRGGKHLVPSGTVVGLGSQL
jgi:L-alanine-DL-glutamate epimerase-like enolase superfamily enzyme